MSFSVSYPNRDKIEEYLASYNLRGYYFNFPVIYALSKNANFPFRFINSKYPRHRVIWTSNSTLEVYTNTEIYADKVLVTPNLPAKQLYRHELFDNEYIYDLDITLSVKNFRDNKRTFERDNPDATFTPITPDNLSDAIEILKSWYKTHPGAQDFSPTITTLEEFTALNLSGFIYYKRDVPRGVSVFVEYPTEQAAVHITSKDLGDAYLQDFMRYHTYDYLHDRGIKWVYDGSDCKVDGLRIYKLKLRPAFIRPLYTWVKS